MPSRDPWPDLNKEELRLLNDVANRGKSAISNPKLAFWLKNQATELQVWAYDLGRRESEHMTAHRDSE